jgi:hypothetical protein
LPFFAICTLKSVPNSRPRILADVSTQFRVHSRRPVTIANCLAQGVATCTSPASVL